MFLPSSMEPNFCLIVGRSNITWGKSFFTVDLINANRLLNKQLFLKGFTLGPSPLQLFSHQLLWGVLLSDFCSVFLSTQTLHQQDSQGLSTDRATDHKIQVTLGLVTTCSKYRELLLLFGFLLFFVRYSGWAFRLVRLCWHWSNVTRCCPQPPTVHMLNLNNKGCSYIFLLWSWSLETSGIDDTSDVAWLFCEWKLAVAAAVLID